MRFWVPLICLPYQQYTPLAEAADRLGYQGALVADHLAIPEEFASVHPSGENPFTAATEFPDAVTTIASLAARTERLRFMTYALVLPLRDPFTVAKQFGTAALLSGDRVTLGTAVGWLAEEFDTVGATFAGRGARTDEMLEIIRDFWDDGWAEHHGRHHDFPRSGMFPVPRRRIPVLVGGHGPAALRRAVRHDGWLGMNHSLERIGELTAQLAALRAEHGDTRPDFQVFAVPNAVPCEETFDRLAELGVTDTIAVPWQVGSHEPQPLQARLDGLEAFAARYLHRS